MYNVLEKTWSEMMDSELSFKSSWRVNTIEMKGSDVDGSYAEDSSILIVYNVATGFPILLVERMTGSKEIDESEKIFENIPREFVMHIDHYEKRNREYTDIVLTRRELYDSIMQSERAINSSLH